MIGFPLTNAIALFSQRRIFHDPNLPYAARRMLVGRMRQSGAPDAPERKEPCADGSLPWTGKRSVAPLYVSSKGRYLWSERPYTLRAENGVMTCEGAGEAVLSEGHDNLKGAYLAACAAIFPSPGRCRISVSSPSPSTTRGSSWAPIRPRTIFSAMPEAFWSMAFPPVS